MRTVSRPSWTIRCFWMCAALPASRRLRAASRSAAAAYRPRASGGFGGGYGYGNGSGFLTKNNQTQAYSFSASPYAVHRFGDAGTLTIADRVSETVFNNKGSNGTPFSGQNSLPNS